MNFLWSWILDYLEPSEKAFLEPPKSSPGEKSFGPFNKEALVKDLILAGNEVASVEEAYGWGRKIFPVRLETIEPHPQAKNLQLCHFTLHGQSHQIVCGAKNPRVGLITFFAPVGTLLPGEKKPLEEISLRGVKSAGMLCSLEELTLGDYFAPHCSEGIVDLEQLSHLSSSCFSTQALQNLLGEFARNEVMGKNLYDLLGSSLKEDFVLSVDLTPNRGDLFSHLGMARELQALGFGFLKGQDTLYQEKERTKHYSSLKVQEPVLRDPGCRHLLLSACLHVKNETPQWMKRRLGALGLSSQSFPVDITNYIAQDLGQPMHVFSWEDLDGTLFFTRSKAKEECTTLDGQVLSLQEGSLVARGGFKSSDIHKEDNLVEDLDDVGDSFYYLNKKTPSSVEKTQLEEDYPVVALAGVMGAQKASFQPSCGHLLFEVADFDPFDIALSGQHYHLTTASRQRFERGVDGEGLHRAMNKALDLYFGGYSFVEGQLLKNRHISTLSARDQHIFFYEEGHYTPRESFVFQPSLLKTLGGSLLGAEEACEKLLSLGAHIEHISSHVAEHSSSCDNGFSRVSPTSQDLYLTASDHEENQRFLVTPPSWRTQWSLPEDCVMEILRLDGFQQCPAQNLPSYDKESLNHHSPESHNTFFDGSLLSTSSSQPLLRQEGSLGHFPEVFQIYKTSDFFDQERIFKNILHHQGFCEAMTYSMISEKEASLWQKALPFFFQENLVPLVNPLSQDMAFLRPNLLPGLLQVLDYHRSYDLVLDPIMEFGPVFAGPQPMDQDHHVGFLLPLDTRKAWDEPKEYTFFHGKSMIEKALKTLFSQDCFQHLFSWGPIDPSSQLFHHGQSAYLYGHCHQGEKILLGIFGRFHPRLEKRGFGGELSFTKIFQLLKEKSLLKKPYSFSLQQPLVKDLSFFAPDKKQGHHPFDVLRRQWMDLPMVQDVVLRDLFYQEDQEKLSLTCGFFLDVPQGKTAEDIREILKILRDKAQDHGYELRGTLP